MKYSKVISGTTLAVALLTWTNMSLSASATSNCGQICCTTLTMHCPGFLTVLQEVV